MRYREGAQQGANANSIGSREEASPCTRYLPLHRECARWSPAFSSSSVQKSKSKGRAKKGATASTPAPALERPMGLGLHAVVDISEVCRGNKIWSAHPPGLYEHGLQVVTIRKLDIDMVCLHRRDNLDHFGPACTVATTDARRVEPSSTHAHE